MPEQWFSHPLVILAISVATFFPLRVAFGGGGYLPSRPWYLLCIIVWGYVVLGFSLGAFCAPIAADWPTALHIVIALAFTQLDLCVASYLVDSPAAFGEWRLPKLLLDKLSLDPRRDSPDGMAVPGICPLVRSIYEFNGALFHEIFWNIFICWNCVVWGAPVPLAILAVPAASCLVHGITCNFHQGVRCFPNFVWVALAFHASGSILVPGLIHALWYFTDAKLCFALKTMKREWDVRQRAEELSTPPWDRTCSIGLFLIISVYLPLNVLAESGWPWPWRSETGWDYVASCSYVQMPGRAVERALIASGLLQICVGVATWGQIRAGMDVLQETGDLSDQGVRAVAAAVRAHATQSAACPLEEGSSGDGSSSDIE